MSEKPPRSQEEESEQNTLGWDFEGARRFQARLGLEMTPAERLQWLEDTVAEMRELCGRAQQSRDDPR